MKKLLVVLFILATAATANAGFTLSASDPFLVPDETAVVRIFDDYLYDYDQGSYFLGMSGPGSLNIDNVTSEYPGDIDFSWLNDPEFADWLGIQNPFVGIEVGDIYGPPFPTLLDYDLADNIIFTCEGWGNVTLALFDDEGALIDNLIITQPEPASALLMIVGTCMLGLSRRKH